MGGKKIRLKIKLKFFHDKAIKIIKKILLLHFYVHFKYLFTFFDNFLSKLFKMLFFTLKNI